jgi:N6-adenosine-specific RNA methylase IME4
MTERPIDSVTVPGRLRALRTEAVRELADSIASVGLLNPISVTPDGVLVAGLHRLHACRSLGWTTIPVSVVDLDADHRELSEIDENLIRAELTELEKGEHVARRKAVYERLHPAAPSGRGGDRRSTETVSVDSFTADTAAKTGISERTVRLDVQVGSMPEPVREAVRNTPVADRKRDLIELARMEPERQAVVAEAIAAGAPSVAEAKRLIPADDDSAILAEAKRIREERARANREMTEAKKAARVDPPSGLYRCIVIDPPWELTVIERDNRPAQAGLTYPTMTEAELMAFKLPAAEECHLYLWTTHKHLPLALRLAEAWGFRYQCLLTWSKNVGFTPFSWMYSTEHALFCTRGGLRLDKLGMRLDFRADRREHSRKPDEFYDLVRQASPGPRIDMFSRETREGFVSWGNETSAFEEAG